MAHVLKYKWPTVTPWFTDLLVEKLQKESIRSFKIYIAATTLQKYIRGYLTRKTIKKWNAAATMIQKIWRGYSGRVYSVRFARIRYCEMRNKYYDDMAARIQSVWRGYVSRKNPVHGGGMLNFIHNVNRANKIATKAVKRFQEIETIREQNEIMEEKKRWLNYTLPKLHHLIRTKGNPGIYSLKDGREEYSFIEKLLSCYDFSNFMHELNFERKKFTEQFRTITPLYRFKGSFKRCEKDWKEKNLLQEPKL